MSDLSKYEVKITAPAFADIRAIASFTFEQWGQEQARLYMSQIDNKIQALEHDPDLGRERYGLPKAIKGCKSGSHIIFYRVKNRVIFIMRILHQSMDHGRHIGSDDQRKI